MMPSPGAATPKSQNAEEAPLDVLVGHQRGCGPSYTIRVGAVMNPFLALTPRRNRMTRGRRLRHSGLLPVRLLALNADATTIPRGRGSSGIVGGLCLAFVLGLAAHRFGVPPLVGYLLAGVVV